MYEKPVAGQGEEKRHVMALMIAGIQKPLVFSSATERGAKAHSGLLSAD